MERVQRATKTYSLPIELIESLRNAAHARSTTQSELLARAAYSYLGITPGAGVFESSEKTEDKLAAQATPKELEWENYVRRESTDKGVERGTYLSNMMKTYLEWFPGTTPEEIHQRFDLPLTEWIAAGRPANFPLED